VLPGAAAFPESVGADPRTGSFFAGSIVDGTLYRGSVRSDTADVLLPAGSDGRTAVAGVKVDRRGRIWLADAFNGRVLVYSQRGELLHRFELQGPGTPTVNDLAFARDQVYVTDSSRPYLYRLAQADADKAGTTTVAPWLAVAPAVTYRTGDGPFGVNLNGIVASPDGDALLAIQTNTGILFRIDVAGRSISPIDTAGATLRFGDGLLRVGGRLYLARNAANEIVRLRLSRGWTRAQLESTTTSDAFAFPTALAKLGDRLLVTNAQLDAPTDPTLPFTVADLPLP
jgi:sugar lactone lactonase YvrE